MNRKHYVLTTTLLLLVINLFAQSPSKPFNKGNFKIDFGYARLMQDNSTFDYSDYRINAGYGLTEWCVAGVFSSFGTHHYYAAFGLGMLEDTLSNTDSDYYNGEVTECYFHYGLQVELHPLSAFLPSFYYADLYCRGEIGMRTVTEHFVPAYDGPLAQPVRNNFLYGGSIGLALNPSRHFGVFYELAFNNLNKMGIYTEDAMELKTKPIHRFGLNIRF